MKADSPFRHALGTLADHLVVGDFMASDANHNTKEALLINVICYASVIVSPAIFLC